MGEKERISTFVYGLIVTLAVILFTAGYAAYANAAPNTPTQPESQLCVVGQTPDGYILLADC
jgi:hypothetical protein